MESYIQISFLNDFIFCPRSIYFHQLHGRQSTYCYQDTPQIEGKAAHKAIDEKRYSTKKTVLQDFEIYSDKYKLCGKIDIFDCESGILTERKKKIKTIYDGYVFQLYAQYFGLTEAGYDVRFLRLYSSDDNKVFKILLPCDDAIMFEKFEQLIEQINHYDLENFQQINQKKCENCIYEPLCDQSLC